MNRLRSYVECTIPGIFRNRVEVHPENIFCKERISGTWKDYTYREARIFADAVASYLINEGIQQGDKIAIFSKNRPEWYFADQGILSVGAADVTIYPTSSADDAAYIINDSDTRYCFCDGAMQVERLLSVREKVKGLERIISFDAGDFDSPDVVLMKDLIEMGKKENREEEIDKRLRSINPEELMTLMYTSGTTGPQKGVMLSHDNMVSQVIHFIRHQPHPGLQTMLSILPLSHALERSLGYHLMLYTAGAIAISRGPEYLLEDLQEIRPTVFITVPRIPEKMYESLMNNVEKAPAIKKMLFKWAEKTGRKASPFIKAMQPIPSGLRWKYNLADKLIFSKLRKTLGLDRMNCFGSGGAPFSAHVHDFFIGMKVFILPGYGLTETSPVTHTHTHLSLKPIKSGTAGPPIKQVQCRIADDGEILLKGPTVMMGYYKKPEATEEAFTEDGWFKTGDIGTIDEDGYLSITDRKKDIIITAGGKNVAPQRIETLFCSSSYIAQTALVGDRRKYITALVVPDFEFLSEWLVKNNIAETNPAEIVKNSDVRKLFDDIIQETNEKLGNVEKVKKYYLMDHMFSEDDGELTPTMKIKRKIVMEHYSDFIESLYKD